MMKPLSYCDDSLDKEADHASAIERNVDLLWDGSPAGAQSLPLISRNVGKSRMAALRLDYNG
jgi:hypothetical protein